MRLKNRRARSSTRRGFKKGFSWGPGEGPSMEPEAGAAGTPPAEAEQVPGPVAVEIESLIARLRDGVSPVYAIETFLERRALEWVRRIVQASEGRGRCKTRKDERAFDRHEALLEAALFGCLAQLRRPRDPRLDLATSDPGGSAASADPCSPRPDECKPGEPAPDSGSGSAPTPAPVPGAPGPSPVSAVSNEAPATGDASLRWKDRLALDPSVSERSPVVRGTWVTVGQVVSLVVDGWTWADILRAHPELTEEDIRACLWYSVTEDNSSLSL